MRVPEMVWTLLGENSGNSNAHVFLKIVFTFVQSY